MEDATVESGAVERSLVLNRNFVLLWAGQFVSQLGDRLAMVAFPWLIYKSTDSAFSTGAILALYTLPYVLFGTFAGVVIDRFNKRLVMMAADVVRAALVVSVPIVAHRSLTAVYALSFLTASATVFFDPCKLAILPDLVSPAKLIRANSVLATGERLTDVVGYALAGFIAYYLSARAAFSADAVTFVVSAVALALMAYRPSRTDSRGFSTRGVGGEIREGLTFLWSHRGLAANTVLVVTTAIGFGALYPLTFMYAATVVGGGARAFGLMESAIGLGYLVGALAMAALADRVPKGLAMTVGIGVMGAGLAVIASVSSLYVALVPFFVVGLANAAALISIDTYVQQTVPERLRGRVWGVRFTLTEGVYALSVLMGGALATRIPVQSLFLVCAVIVAAPAVVGMFIGSVRRA